MRPLETEAPPNVRFRSADPNGAGGLPLQSSAVMGRLVSTPGRAHHQANCGRTSTTTVRRGACGGCYRCPPSQGLDPITVRGNPIVAVDGPEGYRCQTAVAARLDRRIGMGNDRWQRVRVVRRTGYRRRSPQSRRMPMPAQVDVRQSCWRSLARRKAWQPQRGQRAGCARRMQGRSADLADASVRRAARYAVWSNACSASIPARRHRNYMDTPPTTPSV